MKHKNEDHKIKSMMYQPKPQAKVKALQMNLIKQMITQTMVELRHYNKPVIADYRMMQQRVKRAY